MKLPKNAKLVHKGIIFDTYQWKQKMFDGSYETFEMLKRPNTVQIIATEGNRILVLNEEQPRLKRHVSLIGGRQDEGETPLQCAKRELLEETGYISNDWELYMATDPYIKMEWKIYTFIARNCQKKQAQQLDPGEKITIKKISFSQFLRAIQSTKLPAKELTLHVFGEINQSKTFLSTFKKKIFPTNT
ncbi:MAG TPA: hypothetical protein DCY48_02215 [Candidatus Magasanikbacteria bacterium]|nr:MAG: hypothetical protein A3I74_01120 [Candidatus Magasanikbacteria bacterium RIFCSPLOWO2_02_FULL_47_16]OGH79955.1 MAG: hypothetical protein A3C10_02105 [Candidatus Magasanikbacteria bacterium RIFCSPHIGHO2_02_FULL_48_18]OGH82967.1 MAG: hypothetical protein A3G08_03590 [Candidatus Magasanikbacteria bacterium RIFCSPLOWO2_12_FULL_47_9b]HAZ28570.1 hypothetical protein [Candidatus Magasanikbacteria bacterium]